MGGGDEHGKSSQLSIFTSLKHLMVLLKSNFFFRALFLQLIKDTDSM